MNLSILVVKFYVTIIDVLGFYVTDFDDAILPLFRYNPVDMETVI